VEKMPEETNSKKIGQRIGRGKDGKKVVGRRRIIIHPLNIWEKTKTHAGVNGERKYTTALSWLKIKSKV